MLCFSLLSFFLRNCRKLHKLHQRAKMTGRQGFPRDLSCTEPTSKTTSTAPKRWAFPSICIVNVNPRRKTGEGYMVLSDEVVNALFLPEAEMKKVLVHPCALYYEGDIYTWTKLSQMSVEDLLNHGIPGEVLQSYIDNLIEYCVTNGFIPESHISRYFGTEE